MKRRCLRFALPLGLFLIIFGAKLMVIEKFGSDLPFWDQWDTEAEFVYQPYFEHKLTLASLFIPHNEHRIVFTKLLGLGLLLLNGQWDARLQCVVNAAMHAAILALLLIWVRSNLGPVGTVAAFIMLTAVTAPPLAWENTLGGFQSQFYFLLGFSLASMWLFLNSRAWSHHWWLAFLCALAAIFSMGSGFFCVLPVLAVLACQLAVNRSAWGARLPTLAVCAALAVFGWTLRFNPAWHEPLHAHNAKDFLTAFMHSAAWPMIENARRAWLAYLPLILLFLRWLRRKCAAPTADQFILCGGFWVLLQIAATAYARGGGSALPANRYGDVLAMGVIFNGLALVLLFKELRPSRYGRWVLPIFAMAWSVALISGVKLRWRRELNHELPVKKAWLQASETNVQTYLLTGHFANLGSNRLPYPDADHLAGILNHRTIRDLLPFSVRMPLTVDDPPRPNSNFSVGAISPATPPLAYRKTWGSFTPTSQAERGEWRSSPLLPRHCGFWGFEISGNLGLPGLSLQLVSNRTGSVLADIKPKQPAGDTWRAVYVQTPDEACTLVARDNSAAGWFAFSEPVEMAKGSWSAWLLTERASWFLVAGCILALAGLVPTLRFSTPI